MTLLVISPDFASHLLPLATLATAWRDRGDRVVVATGPATAGLVADFGLEHTSLQLGRGSNPGVMSADDQPDDEAASLRGFFAATHEGMVPTLLYQARERLTDLMWQPAEKARATLAVIESIRPDQILVDHLAFSARVALHTARVPYGDVVLGHPSALPVGEERYGFPPAWPSAFSPDADELAELRALCERVSAGFTREWNRAAQSLDPATPTIVEAFAVHGPLVLYNYPAELGEREGLPPHVFLGSTRRTEAPDAEVDAWLRAPEPFVYVSFGSFLSVRGDVLARVAEALRRLGVRAAIATGATAASELGAIPAEWLVRGYLPQVRLLAAAAAAVTHGGNNSITEALGVGVPLLVLPFSTDQFAGAAAVESRRVGRALDPNAASPEALAAALSELLAPSAELRERLSTIAAAQRELPGPERAYRALTTEPSATSARIASSSPEAAR